MELKDVIERRRSIRSFKPTEVPEECIVELLESARLAPSGSNAQPWRFKVVEDVKTKIKLQKAAYNQKFVGEAPAVIVCCADVKGYLEGTVSGSRDLGKTGALDNEIVEILHKRADELTAMDLDDFGQRIAFNVAIAVEHMVLRAVDLGLGTCWVRLFNEPEVRGIFGWDENIFVVALLPLGYPDESPKPRKRLQMRDILIE